LQQYKKDDWRGNRIKQREIKYALKKYLSADKVDAIFEKITNQQEY